MTDSHLGHAPYASVTKGTRRNRSKCYKVSRALASGGRAAVEVQPEITSGVSDDTACKCCARTVCPVEEMTRHSESEF